MIGFDDRRWDGLKGGYKLPYDARPAFKNLEAGMHLDAAYAELWDELHHQGDVGDASYAAVPHLVRIQARRPDVNWNL